MAEIYKGEASFYGAGEKLNQYTTSGFPFSGFTPGVACWLFPLGSLIKITNGFENVRFVYNFDRGPAKSLVEQGRIADCFYNTYLGLDADEKKGLINISIELIAEPDAALEAYFRARERQAYSFDGWIEHLRWIEDMKKRWKVK